MRVLRWASRLWTGLLLLIVVAFGLLWGLRFVLPLLPFMPQPALAATIPLPDATAVAPQSALTLRFTVPMNPRSVEQHVSLEPAVPLRFAWNNDQTTLVATPVRPFAPGVRYTFVLDSGATSRWFRPMTSATTLAFAVVAAPEVLATNPPANAADVATNSPITISFSRPIIDPELVAQPQTTPLLRFEPPISGTTTWVDTATALFQPDAVLQPATRYVAILDAGLVDASGGQSEEPYVWAFSTPAPRVLEVSPASGDEQVPPRSPVVMRLSQGFDPTMLAAALTISPTVTGQISTLELAATQLITFTPDVAWNTDTAYTLDIAAVLPRTGTIPLEPFRWSFRTAPQPRIIGRFPGANQVLAADQGLRLIFTTPVDAESLRGAVRFEPAIEPLRITAASNEARISANFQAATVYTLTLAPELTDANQVALGTPYQLQFQTAPAVPAVSFPGAQNAVVRIAPSENALLFRRVNVSRLDMGLYSLDEDSTARLLGFGTDDWRDFEPDRAGLNPIRLWSQTFTDTANVVIDAQLSLRADDTPQLAEGAYYVRLRGPDGVSGDLLVFVSETTLSVRQSASTTIVWATNAVGAPIEGLPIALYRDGVLLARGQTGQNGVLQASVAAGARAPLVAVSERGGIAVESIMEPVVPLFQATLIPNQTSYTAGSTILVGGFFRTTDLAQPLPSRSRGTLTLRNRTTTERIVSSPIEITSSGVISASMPLPHVMVPGAYVLALDVANQQFTSNLLIVPAVLPRLTIDAPPFIVAGEALTATMQTDSLLLAGVPFSWTLSLETLDSQDNLQLGDEAVAPQTVAGAGAFDLAGRATVVLSPTVQASQPMRYEIVASVAATSDAPVIARASGALYPADGVPGLQLSSRVSSVDVPILAQVNMIGPDNAVLADRTLLVELFRLPRGEFPDDASAQRRLRVANQTLRTDMQGQASISLPAPQGGVYRLVVSATDQAGRVSRTAVPVWRTASGFNDWPDQGRFELVADKTRYQAGDTASLLVAAPIQPGAALVVTRRDSTLEADVRPLLPGDVITVPVGLDSPFVSVEVLLTNQNQTAPRVATIVLPVDIKNQQIALSSDQAAYIPGATATFTVTTTDMAGQPVAADVIFGLSTIPHAGGELAFQPRSQAIAPEPSGETVVWRTDLRTDAAGQLTFTARMPDTPTSLLATAWVPGQTSGPNTAQLALVVEAPLIATLAGPPLMRTGDEIELQARLRNTTTASMQLDLSLLPVGFDLLDADETRTISLAGGSEQILRWRARVGFGVSATATLQVRNPGRAPLTVRAEWPVELAQPQRQTSTSLIADRLSTMVEGGQALQVLVVPSLVALKREGITTLAALGEPSSLDHAALLLLTTSLSDTDQLAEDALALLLHAQHADGGWSWQRYQPSEGDTTLFVLEALAAAQANGMEVPETAIERGLATLDNSTTVSEQARHVYARSLFDRNDPRIAVLANDPQALEPSAIARLLLARVPNPTRDRALIEAMLSGVIHDADGAHIASDALGGDVAATALAVQALIHARPDAPVVAELQRWLVAHWNGFDTTNSMLIAHVARAFEGVLPQSAPRSFDITLNSRPLSATPQASFVPSDTQRLVVPPTQLRATNTLTATVNGGVVLLGLARNQTATSNDTMLVLREYLDPATNQPVDKTSIRANQRVLVRLSMIVQQPLRYVTLVDPLAGGLMPVVAYDQEPLAMIRQNQVVFNFTDLAPGVFQQTYMLQAVSTGQFFVPASYATTSDGTIAGRGNAAAVRVLP